MFIENVLKQMSEKPQFHKGTMTLITFIFTSLKYHCKLENIKFGEWRLGSKITVCYMVLQALEGTIINVCKENTARKLI